MNNVIKISRVYIENFKSIEKACLGFKNQTVTVLDGPNGFGKTSIYDVIELILTGSIRRIKQLKINVGNRGYDDYLFAKDQFKPIILKVELEVFDADFDLIERIIVGRKIEPSSLNRSRKRPFDFDYTVHLLGDFEENLTNRNKSSQTTIEELFGISDFASKFGLYHYIEQEESSHLLKKNEKERMDSISKLFNIESEMNERDILEKAKNKLIRHKTSLNQKISEIAIDSTTIEENAQSSEVEYSQLINIPSNKIVWDQKIIKPLDKENKATYLEQLEAIKGLLTNFAEFMLESQNERIRGIASKDQRLSALIVLGHFEEEFEQIKNSHNLKKKFENIKVKIENKEIFTTDLNWNLVYEHFKLTISKEDLNQKVNFIKGLRTNSSNLSRIVEKLLLTRKDLVSKYDEYIKSKQIDGNDCPLCGREWESYQDLITQMDNKTELLKEELDNSSTNILKEIDNLYEKYLTQLVIDLDEFIKKSINDAFFNQLHEYKLLNIDFNAAKKFFSELNIDISAYFNKEKNYVKNLSERVESIKDSLYGKLSKSILEIDKFNEYKEFYRNIFANNEEILKGINIANIDQKKQYIEYMYYMQASESFIKHQKLVNQLRLVDESINSLTDSIGIYNEKINGYRAKMISDIEIPFYIYSGKIIQNHQRGIGVFIKEDPNEQTDDPQLKAINFVPPEKTDHDIMHSFSSGQLSATVLAFSLALNKVYNNSGLGTLLIDDPIQTMDEINMASFVELLRNDFSDRQIILSTHEDKISMYIRYKFSKYGHRTGNINVKEEFYQ
ncbi:DNA replication and repair protein RecF [Neobacillus rhizosphaerae]|uniref:Nuclease SbcCD subunit C n=1 Tax=Neobacillus rhizosphaerae TaxID=2880965 RepID=A0ABM9ER15_9BACI|nr:AAA family ATPase [Neobacillus rhizosphaerae]CAH2715080.1 DNA replication and repair protein RecF [Neobacillus rhizosphaerae]